MEDIRDLLIEVAKTSDIKMTITTRELTVETTNLGLIENVGILKKKLPNVENH